MNEHQAGALRQEAVEDRELLERAARAAGLLTKPDRDSVWIVEDDGSPVRRWRPLTDDGDALRLAVRLEIQAGYSEFSGESVASWARGFYQVREYGPDDPYAATRRAIVRAAASMGEQSNG